MSSRFNYPFAPIGWQASPHDFTGDNLLKIYTTETTQRFVLGTRYITWDGRVFKYSLSNFACPAGRGAFNFQAPFIADDGATHPANTTVVGDTSFTIASQTVVEDALAGGFVILYTNAEDETQTRGIIGNTVGAPATITVYLEAPLTAVATGTTDICMYYSPYYGLKGSAGVTEYGSVVGIPATYVSAASMFFWGQTWGPCRVTPGEAGFGEDAGERQMVFDGGGSLRAHTNTYAITKQLQHAGFIIPLTTTVDDAPLTMLQLSV